MAKQTQNNKNSKNTRIEEEQGLDVIVKKLIIKGKRQGFLSYDEINVSLPAEASDKIEGVLATIASSKF